MPLQKRIDYMLFWGDPERREAQFKIADQKLWELHHGFDLDQEMSIGWTDGDTALWDAFKSNKSSISKLYRVVWSKWEWRFFKRVCGGVDLVSGLHMTEIGQPGDVDRLSNTGSYQLGSVIYIPRGTNYAKNYLTCFDDDTIFEGLENEYDRCHQTILLLLRLYMIDTADRMRDRLPM